jgi:hypothetical protein
MLCASGCSNSSTTTSTPVAPSTATTTTASPEPFTISYTVGEGGSPASFFIAFEAAINRYTWYQSGENVFGGFAGKRLTLSQIQGTGTITSYSNYDAFDVEVFMDGKSVGASPGVSVLTGTEKPSGFTRYGAAQLRFSVLRDGGFNTNRNSNVNTNFNFLFTSPSTLSSTPTLVVTKSLPPTTLDLASADGVHMTTFWWTENPQTYLKLKDLKIVVSGTMQ